MSPQRQYAEKDPSYIEQREGVTPRHVAEHIRIHPYHGRDQQLAEGWLVILDAIDEGRDPLEDLQKFVTMSFLNGNNNGVPQDLAGY